jgi:predicted hydrolase (HD superfamily)
MSEATCRIHGNVAYRGCAFCTISDLREALAAAERERDAAVEKAESLEIHVQSNYRLAAERDEAVKRAEAAEARLDRVKNACVCDELSAQLAALRGAVETCTREYNSDEIRWDYWFDYERVTAAIASFSPTSDPADNGSPTDAKLADALAAHEANPQTPEQEKAEFALSLVSDCDGVFDPTARPDTDTETGECDG